MADLRDPARTSSLEKGAQSPAGPPLSRGGALGLGSALPDRFSLMPKSSPFVTSRCTCTSVSCSPIATHLMSRHVSPITRSQGPGGGMFARGGGRLSCLFMFCFVFQEHLSLPHTRIKPRWHPCDRRGSSLPLCGRTEPTVALENPVGRLAGLSPLESLWAERGGLSASPLGSCPARPQDGNPRVPPVSLCWAEQAQSRWRSEGSPAPPNSDHGPPFFFRSGASVLSAWPGPLTDSTLPGGPLSSTGRCTGHAGPGASQDQSLSHASCRKSSLTAPPFSGKASHTRRPSHMTGTSQQLALLTRGCVWLASIPTPPISSSEGTRSTQC